MENKKDSPGVYIPPPLFYVLVFLLALFIQKKIWIDDFLFHLPITKGIGILLLVISMLFSLQVWGNFSKVKILTYKTSVLTSDNWHLQYSRNPMYWVVVCVFRNSLFDWKLVEYDFTTCHFTCYSGIYN